ncbi:MAG: acyl carrier protein, partial [Halobacteria archaeon]|nr:acyl carrier protein [Halobacteria archaeon]
MTGPAEQPDSRDEALLDLVRQLVVELHPRRQRTLRVALDSVLDRDLGFDSLSRMELLRRIEGAFAVGLPEQVLATADTPRDLLRAISSAHATGRPGAFAKVRT